MNKLKHLQYGNVHTQFKFPKYGSAAINKFINTFLNVHKLFIDKLLYLCYNIVTVKETHRQRYTDTETTNYRKR